MYSSFNMGVDPTIKGRMHARDICNTILENINTMDSNELN